MNWLFIFRVHDLNLTFSHKIAYRDTKQWKNLNDSDKTSNDLELHISIISDIWSKILPPNNMTMKTTPPYYLGHHALVSIFKKICSEKGTFDLFMKDVMKIRICFSYDITSTL